LRGSSISDTTLMDAGCGSFGYSNR